MNDLHVAIPDGAEGADRAVNGGGIAQSKAAVVLKLNVEHVVF